MVEHHPNKGPRMRSLLILMAMSLTAFGCASERVHIHSSDGNHGPVVIHNRDATVTVVQTVNGTTRVHTAEPWQEVHIIEPRGSAGNHHQRIQVRNTRHHRQHTVIVNPRPIFHYRSRRGTVNITIH